MSDIDRLFKLIQKSAASGTGTSVPQGLGGAKPPQGKDFPVQEAPPPSATVAKPDIPPSAAAPSKPSRAEYAKKFFAEFKKSWTPKNVANSMRNAAERTGGEVR